jgi:hypothetical protein
MGTLRGDNGGGRPFDGGGLPDLPPEWGTIIIPDDPAELSHESAQLRRELRRSARRDRWRRRLRLRPVISSRSRDASALGLPLLIMAVAIIATLTSLFALAWPGPGTRGAGAQRASATASAPIIPDLTLLATDGSPLHVRNSLPAVLLLTDDCGCGNLALATAQQVPAGVTVLAVARTAPVLPTATAAGLQLRAAADPQGQLRGAYGGGSAQDPGVIAVLVKGSGEVIRRVPRVQAVSDFAADLPRLG